jgi:hypothetical protein
MKHGEILLLSILCLFSGCSSNMYGTKYAYSYSLADTDNRFNTTGNNIMSYRDSLINVDFKIDSKNIAFEITNLYSSTIKIIWDETLYIKNGKTAKVLHAGVKYNDRNQSQPPSVIPSGTKLVDLIVPTENVYWRNPTQGYLGYNPGGWEEVDLFPTQDFYNKEIRNTILSQKGVEFIVYMPIVVNNTTKEYQFKFRINDVYQAPKERKEHFMNTKKKV